MMNGAFGNHVGEGDSVVIVRVAPGDVATNNTEHADQQHALI